jgi:hypothetical protein
MKIIREQIPRIQLSVGSLRRKSTGHAANEIVLTFQIRIPKISDGNNHNRKDVKEKKEKIKNQKQNMK